MKNVREKNKEKILLGKKEYYEKNKERILAQKKEQFKAKKVNILEQKKEYHMKKRESILDKKKDYYEAKKKTILDKKKEYYVEEKEQILCQNAEYYEEKKETILNHKKQYYKEKQEEILNKKKEYHVQNREDICKKKAASYQTSRPLICQRKRFERYLTTKSTKSYLSDQQQHLYHHTEGLCQPETMTFLNHSVEFYDGLCHSCGEKTAVKIIGVNRLVCLGCKKAHCNLCKTEVSPNPEEGCFHFWPPGCTLNFIPGYCPLYSIYPADYGAINCIINKKECRMCEDIKRRYPEYELFSETVNKNVLYQCWDYRKMDVQIYLCNLCNTKVNFVCEFDHHMRSHTKYGNKVAIVGFIAKIDEPPGRGHIKQENYAKIEKEFMKIYGVVSVLTILWKEHLKQYFHQDSLQDIKLGAALLISPGIDIDAQILKICINRNLIRRLKVLVVRPHFVPDNPGWDEFDNDRQKFHKLMCWAELRIPCQPEPEPRTRARNRALLTTRCSLTFPDDR